MSDSDEPQVIINSDSEESADDDRYDDETDDDEDVEEDVVDNEDDDDDEEDDELEDDEAEDDEDDDDYDDGDLMKSVIHNTETKTEETKTEETKTEETKTEEPKSSSENVVAMTLTTQPTHIPVYHSTSSASSKAQTLKTKYMGRRRKLASSYKIYKKRSVKFLRNKFKRDEYKKYMKDVFARLEKEEDADSDGDNDDDDANSSDSLEIVSSSDDGEEEEEKKPQSVEKTASQPVVQTEQQEQVQTVAEKEQQEQVQPVAQTEQHQEIQASPPIEQHEELHLVDVIATYEKVQPTPMEIENHQPTQQVPQIEQKQPMRPTPELEHQQQTQPMRETEQRQQQPHSIPISEQRQPVLSVPQQTQSQSQPLQFVVSSVVGGVGALMAPQPTPQCNDNTPETVQELVTVAFDSYNMPKQNGVDGLSVKPLVSAQDGNISIRFDTVTNTRTTQPSTDSIHPTVPQSTDTKMEHTTTSTTPASPAPKNPINLYKEINELFPKYNQVLTEHVEKCDGDAGGDVEAQVEDDDPRKQAIDDNMLQLANDIKTINELIRQKEVEWNRLLHLKRIKEEIIQRLEREKQKLDIANKVKGAQSAKSLRELKELEEYLGYTSSPYDIKVALNGNNSTLRSNASSVAQLINNRASMKKEELLHENSIIDGLQKFLEKSKYLTKVGKGNHTKSVNKVLPAMSAETAEQDYKMQTDEGCSPYKSNLPSHNVGGGGIKKPNVAYHDVTKTTAKAKRSPWEVEDNVTTTKYSSSKRKHMEIDDYLYETRDLADERFVKPKRQNSGMSSNGVRTIDKQAVPPTMKRKYFQIDDDFETVREYFPTRQHNAKGTLTNKLLLNGGHGTSDLHMQLGAAQHSTPRPQQSNPEHYHSNKQTYSIAETVNGDNTLVLNGNDEEEYQQYGSDYDDNDDQYWNGNAYDHAHAHEDDFTTYKSASSTTKPTRNISLNGRAGTNGNDVDFRMPKCQECHSNESRIACSGCLNQWYCSRECQIASWRHHSQICQK